MKKFVSMLLAFAILFNIGITASATESLQYANDIVNIVFDKESVAPGEEFKVAFYSSDVRYYDEWMIMCSCLPENSESYVEMISYKSDYFPEIYVKDGYVEVCNGDLACTVPKGGLLLEVQYKVLEDAPIGSKIELSLYSLSEMPEYSVEDDVYRSVSVVESTGSDDSGGDSVAVNYCYTVDMGVDQSAAKGEKVSVPVRIDSTLASVGKYNAYDMTFSYDTSVLELDMEQTNTAGYRVTPGDGTVRIQRYGEEAAVGEALNLNFVVKTVGTANVTLLSAKVDARANSIDFDAPAATVTDDGVTVVTSTGYTVSLPDDFTTDEDDFVVEPGGSFTFKQVNFGYEYTFSVTMGDTTTEGLTFGEDGTYTIENITDNVTVAVEGKTPRTFNVTVEGEENVQEGAVQYETTATYMQDYTITITPEHGYITTVTVNVQTEDGKLKTVASSSLRFLNGTRNLVVKGLDITGDLRIVIQKTTEKAYTATFAGNDGCTIDSELISFYVGESITFRLTPGDNYKVVGAYVQWKEKSGINYNTKTIYATQNEDGSYTIEGLPAQDVTLYAICERLNFVEVNTYVEFDDATVFLVKVAGHDPGQSFAWYYEDNVMYKTTNYKNELWEDYTVYSWLVVVPKGEEALTAEIAETKVRCTNQDWFANNVTVDQSGDVNMTGKVDINDAQLVYDMYQGAYSDFNTVSVLKFLNADVNSSGTLNSDDAVAIINSMQNN